MNPLDRIETQIAKGTLKEALASLSELVATTNEFVRHRNAVITLSARYHQLQRRRISGLISSGEAQITENQIRYNTLELLDIFRREWKEVGAGINNENVETVAEYKFSTNQKIKILFFASNPVDLGRSYVEFEFEGINKMMMREGFSKRFDLVFVMDTNPDNLLTYILEHRPNIVHFSGHGSTEGLVFTEEGSKKSILVPKDKLADVFSLFQNVVGCVVLNACYSFDQAKSISKYVPYVIGSSTELSAGNAIKFSNKFYEALGKGEDIDFAFQFAKVRLGLTAGDDQKILMV